MRSTTCLISGMMLMATAFFSTSLGAQTESPNQEPSTDSFVEAVFTENSLNDLLSKNGAVGVRFYNVVNASGTTPGTAMAIAYDANGAEINSGLFNKPYRRSDGVTQVSKLSSNKAAEACNNITAAGFLSYNASFSKSHLESLLNLEDCDGLRVTPASEGSNVNMNVIAVNIDETNNTATDLGSGSGYEMISSEPCPTMCGDESNYINSR